jgi:hypothetical protein
VRHVGLALAAVLWTTAAAADLYRWIDPETGAVKFSNYPPPWYGNEDKQRGAPKVERIPERTQPAPLQEEPPARPAGARPAAALPGATPLAGLEARRKQLLVQLAATVSDPAEFQKLLEEYAKLFAEMDQRDPKGTPARRAEAETVLDKLVKGVSK